MRLAGAFFAVLVASTVSLGISWETWASVPHGKTGEDAGFLFAGNVNVKDTGAIVDPKTHAVEKEELRAAEDELVAGLFDTGAGLGMGLNAARAKPADITLVIFARP